MSTPPLPSTAASSSSSSSGAAPTHTAAAEGQNPSTAAQSANGRSNTPNGNSTAPSNTSPMSQTHRQPPHDPNNYYSRLMLQWQESAADSEQRIKVVQTVRERVDELYQRGDDYQSFLLYVLPQFSRYLYTDTKPSFNPDEPVYRTRLTIMEILSRCPINEHLKAYAVDLFRVCLLIVTQDSEEMGLHALRVCSDLYKAFNTQLAQFSNELCRVVINILAGMSVDHFDEFLQPSQRSAHQRQPSNSTTSPAAASDASSTTSTPGAEQQASAATGAAPRSTSSTSSSNNSQPSPAHAHQLLPNGHRPAPMAKHSYKLAAEAGMVVMLLFQAQPQLSNSTLDTLVPYLMQDLTLKAPSPYVTPSVPYNHTDKSTLQKHKTVYTDFLKAQAKILGFLTWLIRTFTDRLLSQADALGAAIVHLLATAPPDNSEIRREILISMRHILSVSPQNEFKAGLMKQLDSLMDDNVLIGPHQSIHRYTNTDSIRPLAYSTLAELVHNQKQLLTQAQLFKIIFIFGRNLHDNTLPLNIQTHSIRLVNGLVDHIYRTHDQTDARGRAMLVRILATVVYKFESLRETIPETLKRIRAKQLKTPAATTESTATSSSTAPAETTSDDALTTADAAAQHRASQQPSSEDTIRELKLLVHTLIRDLRTVVWCISNFRLSYNVPGQPAYKRTIHMDEEEASLMNRLLDAVLPCLQLFAETNGAVVLAEGAQHPSPTLDAEEKAVMDGLAAIFTVVDLKTFRDVIGCQIGQLIHYIVQYPRLTLFILPQHFLQNVNQKVMVSTSPNQQQPNAPQPPADTTTIVPGASKVFADCLLHYLVRRMSTMLYNEPAVNNILVQLFRLVFASVNENEHVLRPYIAQIVTQSLKLSQESTSPIQYLALLRHLFRHIGGGKFETLYKEFLPLLSDLLQGLVDLQCRSSSQVREISVELALTVPARLSSLLPYIPLLMKTVLSALQAHDEQVIKLGLRTLEFWVDNLNPDYLYPHTQPVLAELMRSLCKLLNSQPPFATMALNVLGKLGGRNRRFLHLLYSLEWQNKTKDSHQLQLAFLNQPTALAPPKYDDFSLTIDRLIETNKSITEGKEGVVYGDDSANLHTKQQSFCFTRAAIISLLQLEQSSEALQQLQATNDKLAHDLKQNLARNSDSAMFGPTTLKAGQLPSDSIAEIEANKARVKYSATEGGLETLLTSLLIACSDEALMKNTEFGAKLFLDGLIVHFAAIYTAVGDLTPDLAQQHLNPMVLINVIVELMTHENSAYSQIALYTLRALLNSFVLYIGKDAASSLSVQNELLSRLTHCCYEVTWEQRNAGCQGISAMVETLSEKWIVDNLNELVKSLVFTFKDNSCELDRNTATQATKTLDKVIYIALEQANAINIMDQYPPPKPPTTATTPSKHAAEEEKRADNSGPAAADTKMAVEEKKLKEEPELKKDEVAQPSSAEKQQSTSPERNAVTTQPAPVSFAPPAFPTPASETLEKLMSMLVPELIMSTSSMRKCTHQALQQISDLTKIPVISLLHKYHSRLLQPMIARSFQQLPTGVKLGYISAAAFCISLPLLPGQSLLSAQQLTYLLKDVIADLMDEEQKNANQTQAPVVGRMHGTLNQSTSKPALQSALRVESLNLIATALSTNEMRNHSLKEHKDLKENVVRIFFRSLLSRHPDVVAAAKRGLRVVIDQERLPKELLQHCLRPILLNLADYRKLSVSLLEGLSRLLELLSSFFHVTLGEKLLEHLRNFADYEMLRKLREEAAKDAQAGLRLRPEDEVRIASAIIELFHLLPPHPEHKFLETLINYVVKLDELLPTLPYQGNWNVGLNQQLQLAAEKDQRRQQAQLDKDSGKALTTGSTVLIGRSESTGRYINCVASPYRQPLLKFLNLKPNTRRTVEIMFRRLTSRRNSGLFFSLFKLDAAEPLRQTLVNDLTDQFLLWTFHYDPVKIAAYYQQPAPAVQPPQGAKNASQSTPPQTAQPQQQQTPSTAQSDANNNNNNQQQPSQAQTPPDSQQSSSQQLTSSQPAAAPQLSAEQTSLEQNERLVQGINLLYIMSAFEPQWLTTPAIRQVMVDTWKNDARLLKAESEESVPLHHVEERRSLAACLLVALKQQHCPQPPTVPTATADAKVTLTVTTTPPAAPPSKIDFEIFWLLLNAFSTRSLVDYTFLQEFYSHQLTETFTAAEQHAILTDFILFYDALSTTDEQRALAIEHVLLPMLHQLQETNEGLLPVTQSDVWTHQINEQLCQRITHHLQPQAQISEDLRIQLLRLLGDMLVALAGTDNAIADDSSSNNNNQQSSQASPARRSDAAQGVGKPLHQNPKELIRLAWTNLKSDWPHTKAWASITISHFFVAFEMPDHVLQQVWNALLKQTQITAETKALIYRAINILLPVLHKRAMTANPSMASHTYIKWLLRRFADESGQPAALMHLLSVVQQHPLHFYPVRHVLLPLLIPNLTRLANTSSRPMSSATEARKMALDLTELVLLWEKQASVDQKKLEAAKNNKASTDETDTEMKDSEAAADDSKRSDDSNIYRMPHASYDTLLTCLVRMGLMLVDSDRSMSRKCTALLSTAMDIWHESPQANYKVSHAVAYVDKSLYSASQNPALEQNPMSMAPLLAYGLEMLNILTRHQPADQMQQNIVHFDRTLSIAFKHVHPTIVQSTATLVETIAKHFPPKNEEMGKPNSTDAAASQQPASAAATAATADGTASAAAADKPTDTEANKEAPSAMDTSTDTNATTSANVSTDNAAATATDASKAATSTDATPTKIDGKDSEMAGASTPPTSAGASAAPASATTAQQPSEVDRFYAHLHDFILTGLKSADKHNIYFQTMLLSSINTINHTFMNTQIVLVFKALKRFWTELVVKQPATKPARDAMTSDDRARLQSITEIVKKLMLVLGSKIASLGEVKRHYLLLLTQVLDKSMDVSSLIEVTRMMTPWLTNAASHKDVLSQKERVAILLHMCRFDRLEHTELMHSLHNIILTIFAELIHNNKVADTLQKLQRAFMIGLRSRDVTIRDQFTVLFHMHIRRTVGDRLKHVIGQQDWEALADSFWITQCNDLLLIIVDDNQQLRVTSSIPTVPPLDAATKTESKSIAKQSSDEQMIDEHRPIANNQSKLSMWRKRTKQAAVDAVRTRAAELAAADKASATAEASNTSDKPAPPSSDTASDLTPTAPDIFDPATGKAIDSVDSKQLYQLQTVWLGIARSASTEDIILPIRDLMHSSNEFSYRLWCALLPKAWPKVNEIQRKQLTVNAISLLSRDWHIGKSIERPLVIPGQAMGLTVGADGSTCVQCMVEAMSLCQPLPELTPELLNFLAKSHNSWFAAMSMQEQLIASAQNSSSVDALSSAALAQTQDSLSWLYRSLQEDDVWHGLAQRRWQSDLSKAALSLQQFGLWERAEDMFFAALSKRAGKDNKESESVMGSVEGVTRAEAMMWEKEWTRCARQLQQWDMLAEFSHSVGNADLAWEASWRLGDWPKLRDYSEKYALGDPSNLTKLYHIYSAIAERRYTEKGAVEKLVDQAGQMSLREWRGLPSFVTSAHVPLLQRFHRLVELTESSALLQDVQNWTNRAQQAVQAAQSAQQTGSVSQGQMAAALGAIPVPSIVRNVLTSWRERLLNKWDDLPAWSDVLSWRNHVFQMVHHTTAILGQIDVTSGPKLHELPWTTIKLAHVARKQGLSTVCLSILSRLSSIPGLQLDGSDMFGRIREQVKTCLTTPYEFTAAMNIINQTNLDAFSSEQKAEIFRLKGEALQHLGYGDESNTAFSASLSVADNYSKGWLSWGMFCDRVFTLKKEAQWAEHALVCYLQALAHSARGSSSQSNSLSASASSGTGSSGGRARLQLARVMWLLTFDRGPNGESVTLSTGPGNIGKAFARYLDGVAVWVWLLWLPQLLTSLSRPEAPVVKSLLGKIARAYPQSLYYTMRAYMQELKDQRQVDAQQQAAQQARQQQQQAAAAAAQQNKTPPQQSTAVKQEGSSDVKSTATPMDVETKESSSEQPQSADGDNKANNAQPQQQPPQQPNFPQSSGIVNAAVVLEELYQSIRRAHAALFSDVERILDEFNRRFVNEPAEELLSAIHAVLLKCFKLPLDASTSDAFTTPVIYHTIDRIHKKYLVIEPQQILNERHKQFLLRYRPAFEQDFIASDRRPQSVTQMIHKLKRWRAHLLWLCTHSNPSSITATAGPAGYSAHLGLDVKLEKQSSYLTRFANPEIEVPGQYTLQLKEPNVDTHALIERFESLIHTSYSHGYCHRRIGMIGTDGTTYWFTIQYTISHITRADERMNQLYVLLNYMLKKFVETRRRHLRYHVPMVVSLSHRLRLVQTHPSALSLEDIYEQSCALRGVDSDQPLLTWRQSLRQVPGGEANPSARLKVYQDICSYQTPDWLLSRYLYRSVPAADQLWALKKTLTVQLALTGMLCYLMRIGDRSLHKLIIWRNSGSLLHSEFFPSYNNMGIIECNESVPFRLTRNMTAALGPHLVEGLLTAAMMSTNSAILKNQEVLKNYLCLFVRDDLTSWNSTNRITLQPTPPTGNNPDGTPIQLSADEAQRDIQRQLRDRVSQNVAGVLKRIHLLLPNDFHPQRDKNIPTQPFSNKASQIVRAAVLKSKLALMNPTWQPWF